MARRPRCRARPGDRHPRVDGRNSPDIGRWNLDGTSPIARRLVQWYDYVRYGPPHARRSTDERGATSDGFSLAILERATGELLIELPENTDAQMLDDDQLATLAPDDGLAVLDIASGATGTAIAIPPRLPARARPQR